MQAIRWLLTFSRLALLSPAPTHTQSKKTTGHSKSKQHLQTCWKKLKSVSIYIKIIPRGDTEVYNPNNWQYSIRVWPLDANQLKHESSLCHLLFLRLWASYLTFLCLSFLICKWNNNSIHFFGLLEWLKELIHVNKNTWKWCLMYGKYSYTLKISTTNILKRITKNIISMKWKQGN